MTDNLTVEVAHGLKARVAAQDHVHPYPLLHRASRQFNAGSASVSGRSMAYLAHGRHHQLPQHRLRRDAAARRKVGRVLRRVDDDDDQVPRAPSHAARHGAPTNVS